MDIHPAIENILVRFRLIEFKPVSDAPRRESVPDFPSGEGTGKHPSCRRCKSSILCKGHPSIIGQEPVAWAAIFAPIGWRT